MDIKWHNTILPYICVKCFHYLRMMFKITAKNITVTLAFDHQGNMLIIQSKLMFVAILKDKKNVINFLKMS